MSSWYYAGPDAQPVGPISLETLQSHRKSGLIGPDTYILEQSGQAILVWKKYHEVFPDLPPVPSSLIPPAYPRSQTLASPAPSPIPTAAAVTASPQPYNTNAVIGFFLGLFGLLGVFCCGAGVILSSIGVIVSALGYWEIRKNKGAEKGKELALWGFWLSIVTILFVLSTLLLYIIALATGHGSFTLNTSADGD